MPSEACREAGNPSDRHDVAAGEVDGWVGDKQGFDFGAPFLLGSPQWICLWALILKRWSACILDFCFPRCWQGSGGCWDPVRRCCRLRLLLSPAPTVDCKVKLSGGFICQGTGEGVFPILVLQRRSKDLVTAAAKYSTVPLSPPPHPGHWKKRKAHFPRPFSMLFKNAREGEELCSN